MTPEQIGDAVVALAIISGYLLILGVGCYLFVLCVGCLIADFVFPHIPFIERYLESLPDWDDEEDC